MRFPLRYPVLTSHLRDNGRGMRLLPGSCLERTCHDDVLKSAFYLKYAIFRRRKPDSSGMRRVGVGGQNEVILAADDQAQVLSSPVTGGSLLPNTAVDGRVGLIHGRIVIKTSFDDIAYAVLVLSPNCRRNISLWARCGDLRIWTPVACPYGGASAQAMVSAAFCIGVISINSCRLAPYIKFFHPGGMWTCRARLLQSNGNVIADGEAFLCNLFWHEGRLRIQRGIKRMWPLIDHVHERFLNASES